MDPYQSFLDQISCVARTTLNFPRDEPVQIVAHMDSDGLCAAALLCAALDEHAQSFELHITENPGDIPYQKLVGASLVVLCDIGSSSIRKVQQELASTDVVILDHHHIDKKPSCPNIFLLNPNVYGIDGGREICTAGIAYLFVRMIFPGIAKLSFVPIVGMLGDAQEEKGGKLHYLNSLLVDEARRSGSVSVRRELHLFALHSRPLCEALSARSDVWIADITGDRQAAVDLVASITDKDAKTVLYGDLDDREKKALDLAIRSRKTRGELYGNFYAVLDVDPASPWADCRQISTILNACGRMECARAGIDALLGHARARERALEIKDAYRKELILAMKEARMAREDGEGFVIINFKDKVRPTVIGTAASMIAKSSETPEGKVIIILGRTDGQTKVSMRVAGRPTRGVDLHAMLARIVPPLGGSFGGHTFAAGALVDKKKEGLFLSALERELGVLFAQH